MKATDLLEKDHETVKGLFKEFEAGGEDDPEAAQRIFDRVASELEVHSKVEEEIFYPELRDYEECKDLVLESIEEHHVVDVLIEELRGMESGDDEFKAKFEVLRENVLHHAEEEEDELFPKAERLLGKQRLEWLGERIEARKGELTREGQAARKRA